MIGACGPRHAITARERFPALTASTIGVGIGAHHGAIPRESAANPHGGTASPGARW